jgi:ribosomal protein S6
MLRYETLFLAVPEITADETTALESAFDKVVHEAQAKVLSFERWGKYRLAYPVRKYDYGVYFLARFEVAPEHKDRLLEALRTLTAVRYGDIVMRSVIVRLDEKASLEYTRPESLEETPTRDVETFLKENKMTGLLHKSGTGHDRDKETRNTQEIDAEDENQEVQA